MVFRLNGHGFEVAPLSPISVELRPQVSGPLDLVEWLQRDLEEVMEYVRSVSVVVVRSAFIPDDVPTREIKASSEYSNTPTLFHLDNHGRLDGIVWVANGPNRYPLDFELAVDLADAMRASRESLWTEDLGQDTIDSIQLYDLSVGLGDFSKEIDVCLPHKLYAQMTKDQRVDDLRRSQSTSRRAFLSDLFRSRRFQRKFELEAHRRATRETCKRRLEAFHREVLSQLPAGGGYRHRFDIMPDAAVIVNNRLRNSDGELSKKAVCHRGVPGVMAAPPYDSLRRTFIVNGQLQSQYAARLAA
jgi:hypothetical protein